MLDSTTVLVWLPYAAYDRAPMLIITTETIIITLASTLGNLPGSFMLPWMGMIRPIPSKVKIAVPMKSVQSLGLKSWMSLMPP